VQIVCTCYLEASRQWAEEGTHTVSVDEMTGIQALERIAPTKPMRPGQEERREFEYKRHGTQCLIGNFEVATGAVITPTVQATRTEQDCAVHIAATVATDPQAGWIFVTDNLTIHCSESLVRYVAQECGIADDLGKKGRRGVLKSVATRKAFLTDPGHRIRLVYVPKHTSWLNQIEIWFSILVRRVIKRGNFTSVADLREKILAFIDYFNRTLAKPFKWTYTGRPLNV
jgi:transposase